MQTTNRLRSERPRKKYDFYETPYELCRDALKTFRIDEKKFSDIRGLDVGSGNGVWGKVFRHFYAIEPSIGIDINSIPDGIYTLTIQDDFLNESILTGNDYDLVYGNPPYSLAEEFVRRGIEVVNDGGYVFFLLRLAFLESQRRIDLFKENPPKRVYVLQRRPSFFSANGRTRTTDATSYAMFLWQKDWIGKSELDWLYWEYDK